MLNNSSNVFNKKKKPLSQFTEHMKGHNIWRWKFKWVWLGTCMKCCVSLACCFVCPGKSDNQLYCDVECTTEGAWKLLQLCFGLERLMLRIVWNTMDILYKNNTDDCLWIQIFWPLCCLFFFDILILITPLVSSHSSYIL